MMLYFVQDSASCNIKIGFTDKHPRKRLAELQTGCPSKLVLLGTCDGALRDEKRLHHQFRASHVQGEWFRPTSDLIRFILSRVGADLAARICTRAADFLIEADLVAIELMPHEIVEDLVARGITLRLVLTEDGPTIYVRPNGQSVTATDRARIRNWKTEIVALLRRAEQEEVAGEDPPPF